MHAMTCIKHTLCSPWRPHRENAALNCAAAAAAAPPLCRRRRRRLEKAARALCRLSTAVGSSQDRRSSSALCWPPSGAQLQLRAQRLVVGRSITFGTLLAAPGARLRLRAQWRLAGLDIIFCTLRAAARRYARSGSPRTPYRILDEKPPFNEMMEAVPLWCGQNCLVAPRGVAG